LNFTNFGKRILSVCKNNKQCSGSGNTKLEDKIPKEIPETTSGTYKITVLLELPWLTLDIAWA
jgi:hypothetical protein